MNNLGFANKYSHFLQIFAISGSAGILEVDFREVKNNAIAKSYPEPALGYILKLPDTMSFDDFIHEMKTIDRLLKMRA